MNEITSVQPRTIYPFNRYSKDVLPQTARFGGANYVRIEIRSKNGYMYVPEESELDTRKCAAIGFGIVALVAAVAAVVFMALSFPVIVIGGALLACTAALICAVGSLHCCAQRVPQPNDQVGYNSLSIENSDSEEADQDEQDLQKEQELKAVSNTTTQQKIRDLLSGARDKNAKEEEPPVPQSSPLTVPVEQVQTEVTVETVYPMAKVWSGMTKYWHDGRCESLPTSTIHWGLRTSEAVSLSKGKISVTDMNNRIIAFDGKAYDKVLI